MIHNTSSMMRFPNQGMREFGIALHGCGNTLEEAKSNIMRGYQFPQILYMSCGQRKTVGGIEDIPSFDVPCPCGNTNHWIVKYEVFKQPITRRAVAWIRAALRPLLK
jgi:hypothetical protein